jgi:antitoxin VapB
MGLIDLSRETDALAQRLAAAKRLSVEATIQQALERMRAPPALRPSRRDGSSEAVAACIARFDAFAQRIAVAPINDPQPVSEIVDDLNALRGGPRVIGRL